MAAEELMWINRVELEYGDDFDHSQQDWNWFFSPDMEIYSNIYFTPDVYIENLCGINWTINVCSQAHGKRHGGVGRVMIKTRKNLNFMKISERSACSEV